MALSSSPETPSSPDPESVRYWCRKIEPFLDLSQRDYLLPIAESFALREAMLRQREPSLSIEEIRLRLVEKHEAIRASITTATAIMCSLLEAPTHVVSHPPRPTDDLPPDQSGIFRSVANRPLPEMAPVETRPSKIVSLRESILGLLRIFQKLQSVQKNGSLREAIEKEKIVVSEEGTWEPLLALLKRIRSQTFFTWLLQTVFSGEEQPRYARLLSALREDGILEQVERWRGEWRMIQQARRKRIHLRIESYDNRYYLEQLSTLFRQPQRSGEIPLSYHLRRIEAIRRVVREFKDYTKSFVELCRRYLDAEQYLARMLIYSYTSEEVAEVVLEYLGRARNEFTQEIENHRITHGLESFQGICLTIEQMLTELRNLIAHSRPLTKEEAPPCSP